jgi:hypothetical protein
MEHADQDLEFRFCYRIADSIANFTSAQEKSDEELVKEWFTLRTGYDEPVQSRQDLASD